MSFDTFYTKTDIVVGLVCVYDVSPTAAGTLVTESCKGPKSYLGKYIKDLKY